MKILLGILMVMAVGCGKAKDAVVNTFEAPKLMGTWESPCSAEWFSGLSKKTYLNFKGGAFTKVVTIYTDTKCLDAAGEATSTGTFSLPDSNVPETAARKIDYAFEKAYVVAANDKGKEALEKAQLCGGKSFPVGQQVELTKQSRGALCPLHDAPSASYEVFKIEGDKLFVSKIGVLYERGNTDSDRATDLDSDAPYVASKRTL